MPYVSVVTSVKVSDEKKDLLQKKIGELISIIPGKNIDNCMTRIEDCCNLYMGGKSANAVFCEIRLLGNAPHEKKSELYDEIAKLFAEQLGADTLYLNYHVFTEWGSGDSYRML